LPAIRQHLNDLLEREGLTRNETATMTTEAKLKRLNFKQDEWGGTSFAAELRQLCDLATFDAVEDEIRDFKNSRNTLVHEGSFWCEAATRGRKPARFTEAWLEYFFLVSFADRFFLRMLGYSGAYLDWRVYPPQQRNL
jgi:hypothetical protein